MHVHEAGALHASRQELKLHEKAKMMRVTWRKQTRMVRATKKLWTLAKKTLMVGRKPKKDQASLRQRKADRKVLEKGRMRRDRDLVLGGLADDVESGALGLMSRISYEMKRLRAVAISMYELYFEYNNKIPRE